MSVSSPLQTPLVAEETLANGLLQDPGGSGVTVALGVSGDKPCGETTNIGEETTAEEAQEATTVCVTTNSTGLATSTTTSTAIQYDQTTSNSSLSPQGTAKVKWTSEEADQYLSSFQLSMSKEEPSDGRVSGITVCMYLTSGTELAEQIHAPRSILSK